MAWDKTWEEVFQRHEWGKYPAESVIRFVAKNFYTEKRRQIRILEVGCGPGANIWYMAREGFDVYGIDGSRAAIARAGERIKRDGLKASLTTGDAESLPFPDGYFDAVIDNECLAHNSKESALTILKEVKRVLKHAGLFYSRSFTGKTSIGEKRKKVGRMEYKDISDGPFAQRGFVRLMTKKMVKELYGKLFRILSIDLHEYTLNDESIKISEWIIVSQKKD